MNCGKSLLKRTAVWIGLVLFFAAGTGAQGETYYVSMSGKDENVGNMGLPWRTIAHAMAVIQASTSNRHNLLVAEGFYEENFNFKEYVNVYGGYEDGTWARQVEWHPTFIKKADNSPFILQNNMLLDGFFIYGGLQFTYASPKIESCTILMSSSDGIDCSYSSSPVISNCVIKQCAGNGIDISYQSSPYIEKTVVAMNAMDGVRMLTDCNPTLIHVTIGHNLVAGVRAEDNCNPTIDNSILWENGDDLVNCHAMHSCVSEGDLYHSNYTDDPLFVGWSGYNENYPMYVSSYGSYTGTGNFSNPMKYLRQAMAFYRYYLSSSSPYQKKGSDAKDLGAYPSPGIYDPYFGNTAKIFLSPGNYYESDIIVTVPANISGMTGYYATLNPGSDAGLIWGTTGSLSYMIVNGGSAAIRQERGSLTLTHCQILGSLTYGYLCSRGAAQMEDVIIQNSSGTGAEFHEGTPVIINSLFKNNAEAGIGCKGTCSPQIFSSQFLLNDIGISCEDTAMPNIRNSVIGNNTQWGIHAAAESEATILMSRIHNNAIGIQAQDSARVNMFSNFLYDNLSKAIEIDLLSKMRIINNTLCVNNTGISSYDFLAAEIQNCIFWDNTKHLDNCVAIYSDISGGSLGEGNFDSDPLFLDADLRDFHIQDNSPCINAGLDRGVYFRDIDGDARPLGEAIDVGADETSGTWEFSFDRDYQDWKYLTVPATFTPPVFNASGGSISLTSTDNNTFGAWDSPGGVVLAEENQLYRIRFHVRGNSADLSRSPGLRLRVSAQDSQWVDELDVFSLGLGWASPPQGGRDYEMYFVPLSRAPLLPEEKSDLTLTFDIVNLDARDASNATLFLDDVLIEHISLSSLPPFTLEKRYEFSINTEGWTSGGAEPVFLKPLFDSPSGLLTMQSRNNYSCFGFWEIFMSDFELKPNRFYRADFTVRTSVPPSIVPSVRFRVFTEDHAVTFLRMLNSTADASVTLTNQDKTYSSYFVPLEEYTTGDLRGLRLACDLVNMNRQDSYNAIIGIERVSVYSGAIPVFP